MKKKLKITLISSGAGLALAVIIAAVRGVFTADSAKEILLSLTDGSFVSAILLLGVGLLLYSGNGGTFDMLAYGTKTLFSVFQSDQKRKERESFAEYRARKSETPKPVLPFLIAGLFCLALSLCLYVGYANV